MAIGFVLMCAGTAQADDIVAEVAANDGSWSQAPSSASPTAPNAPAQVYDGLRSRMLLFGGWDGNVAVNSLYSLSLSGAPVWTQVATAGTQPVARYAHSMVYDSARDRLLVFGGRDRFNFFGDVWAISLTGTPTWSRVTTAGSPPSARFGHEAIYDPVRDRMVVFAGYDGGFRNDTWELSLSGTPTWTLLAPAGTPPDRRNFSTSIYDPVGDRLVLYGGNTDVGGPTHGLSDAWALSLSGSPTWAALPTTGTAPGPRLLHKSFYDSSRQRLIVIGGYNNFSMVNTVHALTLGASPTWSNLSPAGPLPAARSDHALVYDPVGDRGIVFGGRDLNRYYYDTWQISLAGSPAWTSLQAVVPAPSARLLHKSALDAGRGRMLMFGGWGGTWNNDTWGLNLTATPTWEALSPGGGLAPSPRTDHVAVVDPSGDRLVVFGGRDETSFFNDTSAFGLDSRIWSTLTPAGALPSRREAMAGVYDSVRDRLIIFGGWDGTVALNETWVLTLGATPTWSQVIVSGPAPSPRYAHSMIYDSRRDRVVIFGGYDQTNMFNDAWALDLTGRAKWTRLNPTGLDPTKRYGVEAVYDPIRDRMLLFGGYDGSFLSQVVALDFVGQQAHGKSPRPNWSLLSPAGVGPSRRDFSSAIYDPSHDRLVLFGGNSDATGPVRPVGDTWMLDFGGNAAQPVQVQGSAPTIGGMTGGKGSLEFRLSGAWPNPSYGMLKVAFSLPVQGSGSLDLVDVRGRRVLHQDLSTFAPGSHVVDLSSNAGLETGVYFLRLSQGARTSLRKIAVIR